MRFLRNTSAILAALAFVSPSEGEESLADLLADPGVNLSRPADRARVVARMAEIETGRRHNARAKATRLALPLRSILPNGRIQEIAGFAGDKPLYLITENVNAAISTGADLLRTSPYSLSGSGVTIGLWDGGSARSTHQEFGTRVTVMDGAASIDHATHVTGTLIATGVYAPARGMANGALVDSYDWNSDTSEMTARGASAAGQAGKIHLSNHSYGYVSGWNYVNNGTRVWEWYGSGTSSTSIETDFGVYNTYARDGDSLAFNAPYYLIFRSAGNERTDNPANGQNVALSPGSATVVTYNSSTHPAGDGSYRGGFENIGFNAIGKNVMTVGSITDAVTSGVRDPAKANQSTFSSWGPTDDGRIKPDVVANGDGLTSSLNGSNTAYGIYSGTSMATPNACGSAALLIQQYGQLFPGQAMRSSTLKGLLIHTADDRGNAGPDYKFGWGLVNVKASADLIADHQTHPEKQRITENQLTSSTVTRTQSFVWDGVSPIRATLCWTDPAGTATSTSDLRTPRLVNNLNLKIIAPGGSEFFPYVMPFVGTWTEASMDSPATTGINNTDNVEQVRIAAPPAAGTYQVVVTFSGSLANNSQTYSLLISGSSADAAPPPPLALSSVNPNTGLSGATVTIDLTGASLRADTVVKLTRSGQSDIPATGGQLIGETLRRQVDLTGAAAGAWNVVATNPNLETSTLAAAFTVVGAIWSENFDGAGAGWISEATTGSNAWSPTTAQSQSPSTSRFAPALSGKTTTNLISPSISIPAGATNLQLKFWHNYNLEKVRNDGKDGGVLEFSVDGGAWFDVLASASGTSFASNGYTATIKTTGKPETLSEINNRPAWSGNSGGWVETIVNFTNTAKFANKQLRMRWRLVTDIDDASAGWYVDSIALLGGGDLSNQTPVIDTPASASTSDPITTDGYTLVRGTSSVLSVAANDDTGEPSLTYTWSLTSGPGSPVFFSTNGTNASKTTTANFEGTGDYSFMVSVRDTQGLTVTSAVDVRVLQTSTDIIVSPAATSLTVGATQAFGAALLDQFSVPMASQPSSFIWSASGGGTINAAGLFSATSAGGPFVITASNGGFSNTASVTVNPAPATITLGNLAQTYNGSQKTITTTTNPGGLAVAVTYDGSFTEPVNAGTYAVEAYITNPNYQGSASGSLVIAKATATIDLAGLSQTYDGSPKTVTATSTSPVATILLTYDGSPSAPTAAGTYPILATVTDPNYQGSASGSLVVAKATATIDLAGLSQTYDGSPKTVTATSTSPVATILLTYDGSPSAPTAAGIYPILATVTDPNYQGSASGSLVIAKATATIDLAGLSQTYDGTPKTVTATSTSPVATILLTYDGLTTEPVEIGTYPVVATITDPNYEGGASASLVIAPASDWVSWQDEHFTETEQAAGQASEIADFDFDGLPNLSEYALGTDPRQFTPAPVAVRDGNGLSLTFTRPANLPDVLYSAESSDALGNWAPVPLEVIVEGDPETLRARDPLTTGDPSQRFLRLRFERE